MICNSGAALAMLFNRAKDQLDNDDLEFLSDLGENNRMYLDNIAETLGSLALVLASDDKVNMLKPSDSNMSAILFGLQDSLSTISSAFYVADEVQSELAKRQAQKNPA